MSSLATGTSGWRAEEARAAQVTRLDKQNVGSLCQARGVGQGRICQCDEICTDVNVSILCGLLEDAPVARVGDWDHEAQAE